MNFFDWFVKSDLHLIRNEGIGEEILPGLWLGEAAAAGSEEWIAEHKITHVLACLPTDQDKSPCNKRLLVYDRSSEQLNRYFVSTVKWIHEKLKRNACLLVHCFAGVSRSASIVIAYLISKHDFTFDSAFAYVKSKRPCICPNRGFTAQLRQFTKQLALDRAVTASLLRRENKKQQRKTKRRILTLIWDYNEHHWLKLSTLKDIAIYIFPCSPH